METQDQFTTTINKLNSLDISNNMSLQTVFTDIYEKNLWGSSESRSGLGSELENTEVIRKELPFLLKKYDIKSMLDIPCGDMNWMRSVDFGETTYMGADIVPSLIEQNKQKYPNIDFKVLDLTSDDLPKVDLFFVRDCLGHLSNENVHKAIENMKRSGSKYFIATSFTKHYSNNDITDGGWKCINLTIEPFYLIPKYLINEECKEGYPHFADKCMILFQLND
jgi:hypothetical protein